MYLHSAYSKGLRCTHLRLFPTHPLLSLSFFAWLCFVSKLSFPAFPRRQSSCGQVHQPGNSFPLLPPTLKGIVLQAVKGWCTRRPTSWIGFFVRGLIYAYNDAGLIDDKELLLLADRNVRRNPYFPYWHYARFDLEQMDDDECKAEFRFRKEDVYTLLDALHLPPEIRVYNGVVFDSLYC